MKYFSLQYGQPKWRYDMSLLQENIAYFWFIPVVIQICIPLFMLVCWSVKKLFNVFFTAKIVPETFVTDELKSLVSTA